MKFKATKKEMRANYDTIIKIYYCDAQYLLMFEDKMAYSSGVYGWSCDYYYIDNVLISTGYSPINNRNSNSTTEIIRAYNNKARKICCDYSINWEKQKELVKNLLHDFVKEVTA